MRHFLARSSIFFISFFFKSFKIKICDEPKIFGTHICYWIRKKSQMNQGVIVGTEKTGKTKFSTYKFSGGKQTRVVGEFSKIAHVLIHTLPSSFHVMF